MKIFQSKSDTEIELPLQLNISFQKMISVYEKYATEEYKDHPYHKSAVEMTKEYQKFPELFEGFSDHSLLEKYQHLIDFILEPLFPEALLENEIIAATIPFSFTSFLISIPFLISTSYIFVLVCPDAAAKVNGEKL